MQNVNPCLRYAQLLALFLPSWALPRICISFYETILAVLATSPGTYLYPFQFCCLLSRGKKSSSVWPHQPKAQADLTGPICTVSPAFALLRCAILSSPPPPPTPMDMDDIVEEILRRLPPVAGRPREPRAALVCKRWYCLVTDPHFRRRFRSFHRSAPMIL